MQPCTMVPERREPMLKAITSTKTVYVQGHVIHAKLDHCSFENDSLPIFIFDKRVHIYLYIYTHIKICIEPLKM